MNKVTTVIPFSEVKVGETFTGIDLWSNQRLTYKKTAEAPLRRAREVNCIEIPQKRDNVAQHNEYCKVKREVK